MNESKLQENEKFPLESLVEERNRELIKTNVELERSNCELEQFAYAASHDLQEPLRKIQVFSNLLNNRNAGILNEESKMYLEKITASAVRMTMLVNDLLNFSRSSRDAGPFVRVDLNNVIENIRTDFELLISQKNAIISCQVLPVIEAVQLQMNQLFANLIINALKFARTDIQPEIHISCRGLQSEECLEYPSLDENNVYFDIVIKDNGIGFDPQYAKQIFEIFQRLNCESEYSGSGIGLALCKKVINNHHGVIFAESTEGEGSSFHLVLPTYQHR